MYRYNPDLVEQGQDPFSWDSPEIDTEFSSFVEEEIRYRTLMRANPEEAERRPVRPTRQAHRPRRRHDGDPSGHGPA